MIYNITLYDVVYENGTQSLTHFTWTLSFYTPWKRHKKSGFLTFSGGIGTELRSESG